MRRGGVSTLPRPVLVVVSACAAHPVPAFLRALPLAETRSPNVPGGALISKAAQVEHLSICSVSLAARVSPFPSGSSVPAGEPLPFSSLPEPLFKRGVGLMMTPFHGLIVRIEWENAPLPAEPLGPLEPSVCTLAQGEHKLDPRQVEDNVCRDLLIQQDTVELPQIPI